MPRRGLGCLWVAVVGPVVVVAGIIVGTLLARDDGPREAREVVEEGQVGPWSWEVVAVRDVEGDLCAFLFLDAEQVTGACTTAPQSVTLGGRGTGVEPVTIVFGLAPGDAVRIRVGLAEGGRSPADLAAPDDEPDPAPPADPVEVGTDTGGPVGGRYYVAEVPGALHTTGTVDVLEG